MNDSFQLALFQHEPGPGDVDASLQRIETAAKKAAAGGCQLLLVPEASLTGYNIDNALADTVAQHSDGDAAQRIADICREHSIAIAYGFIEKDNNSRYNTVQLFDKQGKSRSIYRKTHLWGDLDRRLFSSGDDLVPVVEMDGWRIGLLICYDVEFPEAVRRLALESAELILVPTALMSPHTTVADQVVPVRAYESQVFIAYANYCGNEFDLEYVGHSCIVGPDGVDCARAENDPVLLTASLQRSSLQDARNIVPYHRDRRPQLYSVLSK